MSERADPTELPVMSQASEEPAAHDAASTVTDKAREDQPAPDPVLDTASNTVSDVASDAALDPGSESAPDQVVVASHLRGLIEALVFASDRPLSASDIAKAANAQRPQVLELLKDIREFYEQRGIRLMEVAGGFVFRTAPSYGPFVRQVTERRPVKMTRAQLETLAIVAYRQPITRPEVDEIRGVDSGAVLKMLLERGILRIVGKRDEPGRPLLYGTTQAFLALFNLKSLKDLPSLREFAELSEESKRTFDKMMSDQQLQWDFQAGLGHAGAEDGAEIRASDVATTSENNDPRDTAGASDSNAAVASSSDDVEPRGNDNG